jgi:hypothetical protein
MIKFSPSNEQNVVNMGVMVKIYTPRAQSRTEDISFLSLMSNYETSNADYLAGARSMNTRCNPSATKCAVTSSVSHHTACSARCAGIRI